MNTDLDDYLTNKALDGMFLKVQDEEKNIRQNISARISHPTEKSVWQSGQLSTDKCNYPNNILIFVAPQSAFIQKRITFAEVLKFR